jgi:hypothetical protein
VLRTKGPVQGAWPSHYRSAPTWVCTSLVFDCGTVDRIFADDWHSFTTIIANDRDGAKMLPSPVLRQSQEEDAGENSGRRHSILLPCTTVSYYVLLRTSFYYGTPEVALGMYVVRSSPGSSGGGSGGGLSCNTDERSFGPPLKVHMAAFSAPDPEQEA